MIIHRLPDWEARLSALLTRVHDRPFEYGKFDCGQFARLAIQEMTGIDLGDGSQSGYCDPVSAGLLLRRSGANDMGALAEIIAGLHGITEIEPSFAKRGDIVLAKGSEGPGLAVVIDNFALAPSPECDGIGIVPRQNWLRAWSIEHISPQTNIGELFAAVDGPLAFLVPILLSMVLSFAVSAIGSVISKAFTKKPKKSPLSFEDRTITIRQSIEPWHGVIGSARVGGDIFFFEKLGSDIWLGIEWAHHQSEAIDSIYADDEQIFVNGNGSVEGAHNGFLEVYHHLGAATETADAALKIAFPLKWTDAHRGNGITYSILRFVNLATNWGNAIPNMSADIRGALWIDPRTGARSYTDNLAVVTYGLLMDENFGEGAPATEIDTANFITQSNICDEEIILPEWTENWKVANRYLSSFTVNTSTNIITLGASGKAFFTADRIYVWADTTLAAPLVHQTAYYYRLITGTTGTLHPTATDAMNNTNIIDLTTTGTGTQRIIAARAILEFVGRETTFTAVAATDTCTLSDKLYASGSTVIVTLQSTATLPPPLVAGTKYFATMDGAGGMQLFNYPAGGLIDITGTGTGTHTVRIVGEVAQATSTGTDTTADTIRLNPSAGLQPRSIGRALRVASSGTHPAPLQNDQVVYLIPIDSSNIQVAQSLRDAEAGKAIDITSAGSGTWYLELNDINQDEMLGATTGVVAQLINAPDTLPGNFAVATDYYFIRRGHGAFQIADTLQDALQDINREIKPTNGSTLQSTTRWGISLKRERRYTANGVIHTDQDTLDIEKALGACCAGTLLEPLGNGKWRLKVGTYPIPLGVVQLKHIRQGGQLELQCLVEGSEAATTVKGVYSAPLNFDHPSDIPVVSEPNFIEEDGGDEHILDVQYPFTNSKFMARRIAKVDLRRKRMQRTLRLPMMLPTGFKYEFGDGVHIDLSPLPIKFDAEISGWSFNTKSEGEGVPKPSIDLILRETDPWVYR